MPSNPPIVADLANEVSCRCVLLLDAAGQYLPGGLSPCVLQGLRYGCKQVGLTIANPLVLQDADVANLSTFAVERVELEAELFALQWAMKFWWRMVRQHQEAVSTDIVASGWLREQKQAIKDHISTLKGICERPYREPSDETVLSSRRGVTYPTVSPGALPVAEIPGVGGIVVPPALSGDYGYGGGSGFYGGGWYEEGW